MAHPTTSRPHHSPGLVGGLVWLLVLSIASVCAASDLLQQHDAAITHHPLNVLLHQPGLGSLLPQQHNADENNAATTMPIPPLAASSPYYAMLPWWQIHLCAALALIGVVCMAWGLWTTKILQPFQQKNNIGGALLLNKQKKDDGVLPNYYYHHEQQKSCSFHDNTSNSQRYQAPSSSSSSKRTILRLIPSCCLSRQQKACWSYKKVSMSLMSFDDDDDCSSSNSDEEDEELPSLHLDSYSERTLSSTTRHRRGRRRHVRCYRKSAPLSSLFVQQPQANPNMPSLLELDQPQKQRHRSFPFLLLNRNETRMAQSERGTACSSQSRRYRIDGINRDDGRTRKQQQQQQQPQNCRNRLRRQQLREKQRLLPREMEAFTTQEDDDDDDEKNPHDAIDPSDFKERNAPSGPKSLLLYGDSSSSTTSSLTTTTTTTTSLGTTDNTDASQV